MLFNSIDFAIFLPLVFLLYWFGTGKSKNVQNIFILVASYLFYGWWDWRFLSLIIFSTVIDYFIGLALEKTEVARLRKYLVTCSVVVNLALLAVFKYYNFFIENFISAFSFFGADLQLKSLNIILPVGISFYTFQTISYSIDVYKKKIKPTRDFIAFASFVGFFPQLVAGPIERASSLLPQFFSRRSFNYLHATDGLRQMLWGLFKKVVIADNCAIYVDMVFGNPDAFNAGSLLLAALLFPTQVYCDFSGYSEIAIGTARLFGIQLNRNFAFPFFTTTIPEFWRRWHISLYTWFKDYVFLPIALKAKNKNKFVVVKATFITVVLMGFWHGPNWTFILWGFLNATYLSVPIILNKKRNHNEFINPKKVIPDFRDLFKMISTYTVIALTAVLFRSSGIGNAMEFYQNLFSFENIALPEQLPVEFLLILFAFQITEWMGRGNKYAIEKTALQKPVVVRFALYIFIVFLTGMFMETDENPFVYFIF